MLISVCTCVHTLTHLFSQHATLPAPSLQSAISQAFKLILLSREAWSSLFFFYFISFWLMLGPTFTFRNTFINRWCPQYTTWPTHPSQIVTEMVKSCLSPREQHRTTFTFTLVWWKEGENSWWQERSLNNLAWLRHQDCTNSHQSAKQATPSHWTRGREENIDRVTMREYRLKRLTSPSLLLGKKQHDPNECFSQLSPGKNCRPY